MVAISFPLCPPELLLSPLFTRSLSPSIPVLFLGEQRPFCTPLSSSPVALILSSFTSLSLFVSILYSAVTSLPCVIKARFLSFIHPSISLKRVSFFPFSIPKSVHAPFFSVTQPWACCGRCTRWMSREHMCVCTVCVCVLAYWKRRGGCLCSPCLIMWLINSRCQALCCSTPKIQLNTHIFLSHTQKHCNQTERETQSLLHYDLQWWTLQRDGEKRCAREAREE